MKTLTTDGISINVTDIRNACGGEATDFTRVAVHIRDIVEKHKEESETLKFDWHESMAIVQLEKLAGLLWNVDEAF